MIPVPELMRKVFIIEAAMPVMTQVSIAARAYKADANYVAVMTALTTVISLFTIPAYFILLTLGVLEPKEEELRVIFSARWSKVITFWPT